MSFRAYARVLGLATALTGPALAQEGDVDAGETPTIDQIVVTGEKLGRTIQDTTTSVAILTGEELEARSLEDLYDVVLRTPNVGQSFGEKGFNIRGVDQRLAGGAGLLINTIVDGAALPNNQSTFFGPYSAWDVAQVEILRGPQGTTQGRNAIGGAIIINSADPDLNGYEGKARGSYAELDSYQLAAAQNIPLIEDVLALRFAVDQRETDGWVFNPTRGEDYDQRNSLTLRGKALWAPGERFRALWTTSYTDSTGGEDLVDFLRFPEVRENLADLPAEEGSEHLINTLRLDFDITEALSLISTTTYYTHDYMRVEDLNNDPIDTGFLDRLQDDDNITTEARAFFDNGGRVRGIVGVYYGEFDSDVIDNFAVPVTILGIDPAVLEFLGIPPTAKIFQTRDIANNERNYAFFGEAEFDVTDRLTLIAGARYDNERRQQAATQVTTVEVPIPFPLPPDEVSGLDATFDAFLPKGGIRYDVNEDVTIGFTAQRAYRAGGQSISTVSATVADFNPEFAWNYEASLRAILGDGRFAVVANAFYTDWNDQQVTRVTDFGLANGIPLDTITVNAGGSRLFGGEVEIDAYWSDGLSTFIAIGLVDTEFTDFVSGATDNTGNAFSYAPTANVSFGVDYTAPFGLIVRADANWRGDAFSDERNDPNNIIDDYFLANFKVGYETERWSIFGFARNLFDSDYVTQIQNGVTAPDGSIILQNARSGEPRIVGVELNVKWGG